MNETVFSGREFVAAWCAEFGENLRPLPVNTADGTGAFAVSTVGSEALLGMQTLTSRSCCGVRAIQSDLVCGHLREIVHGDGTTGEHVGDTA